MITENKTSKQKAKQRKIKRKILIKMKLFEIVLSVALVVLASLTTFAKADPIASTLGDGKCEKTKVVLVAAASANTGAAAVRELSEAGLEVRAMFRKEGDERAKALEGLPGVKIVIGDFSDPETLKAPLAGVDRAFLVSGAFTHEQYQNEVNFINTAVEAGIEAIVRIGTASALAHPGASCAYGRAHHGIQSFIHFNKYPVVTISSDWFFSNLAFAAEEAKASGKISYPGPADHEPRTFIDARDVARAAVMIMLLPSSTLQKFIAAEDIEVHGFNRVNFKQQLEVLSKAVGYDIEMVQVPADAW